MHVERLLKLGTAVIVYDPAAVENARRIFGNRVLYASSPIYCIRDADCAIIVTEWDEFKKLGPEDFVNNMRNPDRWKEDIRSRGRLP
jgi:UDPglucose 6-dehydrogenase